MGERGQDVGALFPTVLQRYRSLGWETVGSLDDTRLATGTAGWSPPPVLLDSFCAREELRAPGRPKRAPLAD
jgi:hypothetical protein